MNAKSTKLIMEENSMEAWQTTNLDSETNTETNKHVHILVNQIKRYLKSKRYCITSIWQSVAYWASLRTEKISSTNYSNRTSPKDTRQTK